LKSSCLTPLPSLYESGLSYEEGKGVKQDDFKAVKFYQKACNKKRATTARIQITRLLEKLDYLEIILFNALASAIHNHDNFKVVKFYQKACDLNYGSGCYFLGLMYGKGKGVRKSNTENLNALKSSCLTPLPFLYINPRLEQPPP
jgi:hypothetical protein